MNEHTKNVICQRKTIFEFKIGFAFLLIAMCALLFVPQPAIAAILCVTPGGTSGCSSTIGAAVAAAAANERYHRSGSGHLQRGRGHRKAPLVDRGE
jgi:hypothetical protein